MRDGRASRYEPRAISFRVLTSALTLTFAQSIAIAFNAPIAHAATHLIAPAQTTTPYTVPPTWDAAIAQLRLAARYSRDGSHHALLVALRELHDPALRPLFQSLVQAENWTMQVDGVFGLAELDPKGTLDPFLLAQVKNPVDRSTAIIAAVQLGMIDQEQASAMLTWPSLTARDRTLLHAEIFRRGGETDNNAVRALLDETDPEVVGVAGFLLAARGEHEALDRVASRLAELAPKDRSAALVGLAVAAMTFSMKSAVALLDGALKDAQLATDGRVACVSALLKLDRTVGLSAWSAALAAATTQSLRVRLALILISQEGPIPPDASAALKAIAAKSDGPADPLLGKLADALSGISVSSQTGSNAGEAATALAALVATGHRPSMAAVLAAVKFRDEVTRRAVYDAFFQILKAPNRDSLAPAVLDICIDAISQLAALDIRAVEKHIEAAATDATLRELLLLGLFGAGTKEASDVAYAARATASRRIAAMALLLHARFATTSDPGLNRSELEELGSIAAGASPVDGSMRVQAAWLFARHSGKADQAIALALTPALGAGPLPDKTGSSVAETPTNTEETPRP